VKLIELEEGQKLQAIAPVISEKDEDAATGTERTAPLVVRAMNLLPASAS